MGRRAIGGMVPSAKTHTIAGMPGSTGPSNLEQSAPRPGIRRQQPATFACNLHNIMLCRDN